MAVLREPPQSVVIATLRMISLGLLGALDRGKHRQVAGRLKGRPRPYNDRGASRQPALDRLVPPCGWDDGVVGLQQADSNLTTPTKGRFNVELKSTGNSGAADGRAPVSVGKAPPSQRIAANFQLGPLKT
jgi:hypothetical protein